jgi:hypothetical protein
MRHRKFIVYQVARDARTGRFITLRHARRHPRTTVVETVRRRVGGRG